MARWAAKASEASRLGAILLLAGAGWLRAGDSGLNVVVVVNQSSSNSLALGNYYCERRQVPPQNVLRVSWTGGNVAWTRDQFQTTLAGPLEAMLSDRRLADQINVVVLSMDIPYRVSDPTGSNSTTSVLFYGFKTNDLSNPGPCQLAPNSFNAYAGSETVFRLSSPGANPGTFLATLLTGASLAEAQRLVDHGVEADGSAPARTVLLEKTSDPARNVRFVAFDNAIFDMRLNGRFPMVRTNSDQTLGLTNLLGLETGLANLALSPNTFVPGAMADSLTSYGGLLFEPSGQTSLLAFLQAGAAGSFGTVVEPCNYTGKFPDLLNYFYQARGFSLAECYYQSVMNPYEGLIVGEPLAAPFAQPGSGDWVGLPPNAVLAGTTNLTAAFAAADPSRPLQQVDLFVDGTFALALTNIPPAEGNVLSVTLNGLPLDYTVPADATLQSVTAGLADQINAMTPLSHVAAFPTGDRIELEVTDLATAEGDVPVATGQSAGAADALTTFVAAARPSFLDTIAYGSRQFEVTGQPGPGDFLHLLVTKTNGENIIVVVTNPSPPLSAVALTRQWLSLINATPALQTADGLYGEEMEAQGGTDILFRLYARAPGWPAAQVQVQIQASPTLTVRPAGSWRLDQSDRGELQPRNHLYLTAGAANLGATVPLDTTGFTDGVHELVAVACEGSDVRTQTRASRTVSIRNTSLEATFQCLLGGTNMAIEAALPFIVEANRLEIAQIDLFSTGGWLAAATNQATAAFTIWGTNLGPGLHPFYAIVTAQNGGQYRTETKLLRLVGLEPSITLTISASPLTLSWPVVAGRTYDVLGATTLGQPFQVEATVTPTNTGQFSWPAANPPASQRFYRVSVPTP